MTASDDSLPDPIPNEPVAEATADAQLEKADKPSEKLCPQCGASVPHGTPSVLCPRCLLMLGFESQPGLGMPSTDAYRPRFVAPLPEQLAPYFPQLEILERVGYGGMGVVYKARQRELDRLVALKILRPDFENDPGFAERFQREARALAKLNHPHIVAVYDFGKQGDLYFFLMEFVDGTSLRHVEQSGRLTPHEALGIVPQVCDALQYAHEQGVVHRDIKPENILIGKDGRVKIADFGLAKLARPADGAASEAARPLTGTREVVGTPHYMAPEQVERPAEVDHRADIFSLGVVLYEMLTGELPLGRFPPPSQKVSIDFRLDEVVLRALEKEPAQRYQRVTEVRTDVDHIRDSEPQPAAKSATQRGAEKAAWVKERIKVATAFVAALLPAQPPGETKTREQLEQELRVPATALTLLGFTSVIIALVMYFSLPSSPMHVSPTTGFMTLMSIIAGVQAIFCGLCLKSRQYYFATTVGCATLFMLFGFLWPVILPFAIWALVVLRHPGTKSHFTDVPLSDSRAWTTLRDMATNLWSHIVKFSRFVWPKLCTAGTNTAELIPTAITKVIEVAQGKAVTCGAIFLILFLLWCLWCDVVMFAIVLQPRFTKSGVIGSSDFVPAPESAPLAAMLGLCVLIGIVVLIRHCGRRWRSSGLPNLPDRLATPTEGLVSLLFLSFVSGVIVFLTNGGIEEGVRLLVGPHEKFRQTFLVTLGQLTFDLFIVISLALMHWTRRSNLARLTLFVATVAVPLLTAPAIFDSRLPQPLLVPLIPIWLSPPVGLWAMIALKKQFPVKEPESTPHAKSDAVSPTNDSARSELIVMPTGE